MNAETYFVTFCNSSRTYLQRLQRGRHILDIITVCRIDNILDVITVWSIDNILDVITV